MYDLDECLTPIDPGPSLAWYSQHEQQAAAKSAPKDDDEDDDEGDDDEGDDEEGDEDDLADLDEDELKAQLRDTRKRLEGANAQGKRNRLARRAVEAELAKRGTPKPKAKSDDDDDKPDIEAIKEETRREVKHEADQRIKRSEAKAALVAAGVPRDQATDLIGFVKLDDLDIADDGEVEGLDDEIDRIRKKYPAFFAKKTTRRKSVSGEGDRSGDDAKSKRDVSSSQAQADKLLGRTRR